jgi:hypothetical protein
MLGLADVVTALAWFAAALVGVLGILGGFVGFVAAPDNGDGARILLVGVAAGLGGFVVLGWFGGVLWCLARLVEARRADWSTFRDDLRPADRSVRAWP